METTVFAIVCDLRFAIRDRLRSYGNQLLTMYQRSRLVWIVFSYTHIKYSSFFYPLMSQTLNVPQRHIPNCTQHKGFRQNTDPRETDPLLTSLLTPLVTPYKINGRVKIKKCPELSMWPDSSSSINLAYLKLARWWTRCRFPTLVLLLLFSGGFVDGESSTE